MDAHLRSPVLLFSCSKAQNQESSTPRLPYYTPREAGGSRKNGGWGNRRQSRRKAWAISTAAAVGGLSPPRPPARRGFNPLSKGSLHTNPEHLKAFTRGSRCLGRFLRRAENAIANLAIGDIVVRKADGGRRPKAVGEIPGKSGPRNKEMREGGTQHSTGRVSICS